jgi:hypothetical protein
MGFYAYASLSNPASRPTIRESSTDGVTGRELKYCFAIVKGTTKKKDRHGLPGESLLVVIVFFASEA